MQYHGVLRFASVAVLATLVSASAPATRAAAAPTRITVFKDPSCGCCRKWIEHLKKHGFDVISRDTSGMDRVKSTGGVPANLRSCHTAFVKGYVIEGHVPAADIQRLLAEKPKLAGVAVPGMPAGSPGMEVGGRVDKYDVVAFTRAGDHKVFASH